MEQKKSKKKYLVTLGILVILTILISLGGAGETVDNVFQGLGRAVGGLFLGILSYPVVWVFKRKSEYKLEIGLVLGSIVSLLIALANLG